MLNVFGDLRYAARQFKRSPVFTVTAVLTLALGIGGTTAIFTLMNAVMLKSLPVVDPSTLYRIGDGNDCCVEGGPQDRWGMFSYPLYKRLKAATPEFEELAAFQAGGWRLSVRREGVEMAPRPLRSELVTGNYFSTLGVNAFGGRVLTPDDDRASAPPVAVLSHQAWQGIYGADPNILGSTVIVQGHPLTIVGIAPAGFFGETLRGDPPQIWIPLQQEPLISGEGSLLRQSVSAWLRVIGRIRPGASTDGMAPRLTELLHQWMQHESGYPANWMPDIIHGLPKQVINVVPAGAGVGVMKEEYGRSLQILLGVCGLVLLIACANVANLLLVRAIGRRGQTAVQARDRCVSRANRQAGAPRERAALDRRRARRSRRFLCCWPPAPESGISRRAVPANHDETVAAGDWLRLHRRPRHRNHFRRGACLGRHANRSD